MLARHAGVSAATRFLRWLRLAQGTVDCKSTMPMLAAGDRGRLVSAAAAAADDLARRAPRRR